ncbi:MAG: hypothetical protein PHR63_08985 [Methanoregulaceae archaeon]|jgi:hypothetical protein|nr:hypothetical protein [Methanoregulaceae archaeon]
MENRWILIIVVILASMPIQVMAYNNIGAHPSINRYAVDYFEKELLPEGASIRGEESWGYAWDESDGREEYWGVRHTVSERRSKLLQDWIKDGGFSADEPELNMGLVHFYDPTNINEPWLTDPKFLMDNKFLEYVAYARDPYLVIPDLSAVQWAFDQDLGSGYYIQDYSWNDGLRYYEAALASDSRMNPNYGQAWRAVGETMHLISDMTVPAHVRNDGHPWLEPYEASVGAWEVTHYKGGQFLDLNYDQGTLRDLMVRIATVVNRKFYSADTTPVRYLEPGSGSYFTSYSYPQPSLEGLVPDADGYYYLDKRALAREDTSLFQPALPAGVLRNVYRLDEKVLDDQRIVLIPTAIRASAEVLDRFLPRFDARLTVEKFLPEDPDDDQYIVHATLKQVHVEPDAWRGYDLIVRNGAYLIETPPEGKPIEGPLSLTPLWATAPADPNFNDWADLFKFEPGTTVQMKYDLGGYVITSNKVTIPKPTPTPTTSKPKTMTDSPTSTPIPKASWGCANTAACTPDHPELCCPGTTFDDHPCAGCEPCCVWFMDDDPDINRAVCTPPWEKDAGIDVGNKYDGGCWQVRAFCSCETGETVDYKSIDTNPWSSLPG